MKYENLSRKAEKKVTAISREKQTHKTLQQKLKTHGAILLTRETKQT